MMKKKNCEGRPSKQQQPQALNYLKCISEQEEQYLQKLSYKFPYNTLKSQPQNEDLTKWQSTEVNTIGKSPNERSIKHSKLKALPKYHFDVLKTKRRVSNFRKYTDNFIIGDEEDQQQKNKSQRDDSTTRCAINLINKNFKESSVLQRYSTITTQKRVLVDQQASKSQEKRCLAIRKIKKQILSGLQHRKMNQTKDRSENYSGHHLKKAKLCSQIVMNLPFDFKKDEKKQTSRQIRFASLNHYDRYRNITVQKSTERRLQNIDCQKMETIAQFKLLRRLLSNQKM